MASLNEFKIIGNLTRDPDFQPEVGANKQPLCLLDVAVNGSKWDGEKHVPHTEYFNNVAVWGKQGEACAKTLGSGSLVLIEGRLRINSWEKPRDGEEPEKHRTIELIVEHVEFLVVKPKAA